ncbi:PAS domain S-box-containing protein/diguanylate cyclase (GGDEF) domain-containing protein [Aeromonas sp. RU39B]|uniref:sensor domain-containing diguanylate cyclase n=1 Tax=Aeromonas sp. RU39B TaxID=1907416 RepID=UPI0009572E72|nr:diguanylate cyclase [Aeromonas sp. RU39B]SIR61273.1 PAS domain S-box-containing protein/diguanylate cyclase (GGDEF) domain-containing protein [Aeromonas sp. RU39B]
MNDRPVITIQDVDQQVVQTILEVISDGIWDWNANTGFVYRNPGWYRMLGYEPHTLGNTVFTWESVIHPEDLERVMAHFDDYLNGIVPEYGIEYRCKTRQGGYVWIEDRGHIVARNADGSVARMIGAHRDIHARKLLLEQLEQRTYTLEHLVADRTSELQRVNAQLQAQLEENRRLAETDGLTGAANRYAMEKSLQSECDRSQRFNHPLSLLLMDMDNFKRINDRWGHAAGDQTLIGLVALIRPHLREIDLLGRWGGDEFMVVLPNTPLSEAKVVANKIQALLQTHLLVGGERGSLSIGLAQYQRHDTPQQLMVRADRALYQAKRQGKNRICCEP